MISKEQLAQIFVNRKVEHLEPLVKDLNECLKEFEVTSPLRVAAFLAQLGHESGEFRWTEELASGIAYEGRQDLGNTQPGDGVRYKGRSYIQLTGKTNYILAGRALSLDLINYPHLAATVGIGFRIAGWFWKTRGLNELADKEDFQAITRKINGGLRGQQQRAALYLLAKKVLVVDQPKPEIPKAATVPQPAKPKDVVIAKEEQRAPSPEDLPHSGGGKLLKATPIKTKS